MELRVLRYFLTVAKESNMTKAAEFLHVTQPTLSRQIKELEEELGHKLFTRKSHSIELTQEGLILKQRAEDIIDMVTKTEQEFQSNSEEVTGDIYIGCGEGDTMQEVAQFLRNTQLMHPKIKFHLYSGNYEDVTYKLDRGLVDFAVLIQPADISKYHSVRLKKTETWGLVTQKNSPLAGKEIIHLEDLINLPLIVSRQAANTHLSRNELTEWFGDKYEQLNIVATYNLAYNGSILVKAGIGHMLTLNHLINTADDSELKFISLSPEVKSEVNIVWKKEQVFSQAATIFYDAIKDINQPL